MRRISYHLKIKSQLLPTGLCMSRLSAYLGPPITLEYLLPYPADNTAPQGYDFGAGWYTPDGTPAVYTQAIPLCLDTNLPHLARSLSSGLWLFHAGTVLPAASHKPTLLQPLLDEDFIFTHQGSIGDFRSTLGPLLRRFLAPGIEAQMQSQAEAEYLFATLRHLLADDEEISLDQAMAEMFALLEGWLDELPATLNIIISDGEGLYVARHAVNAACASLYYNTDDEAFPNGQLIATQPLTGSDYWQPVPEHHILILNADEPPELLAL